VVEGVQEHRGEEGEVAVPPLAVVVEVAVPLLAEVEEVAVPPLAVVVEVEVVRQHCWQQTRPSSRPPPLSGQRSRYHR